jgi:hypothetical protein
MIIYEKDIKISGVKIIERDNTIDTSLEEIFTGRGIDAKQLRQEAWNRRGHSNQIRLCTGSYL